MSESGQQWTFQRHKGFTVSRATLGKLLRLRDRVEYIWAFTVETLSL